MSRKVNPNSKSLSDDEKRHLAQRGLLPESVLSVEEQRKLLDPEANALTLEQMANTGDANTAGLTIEQLEAELAKRRAEADAVDTSALFGSKSGAAEDEDEDDSSDEALVPPYDQYKKGQLSAEIARRNEDRDEDEQLPLGGKHSELVARLEEDDASSDDEDEDEDPSDDDASGDE